MPRDKERPGFVLMVATLVCVVCALLVSSAVVLLRPVQDRNALLARQRSILEVAGLYQAGQPVDAQFARIEAHLVDLATGAYVEGGDALRFDIARTARDPKASDPVTADADIARIHRRPRQMPVFLVRGDAGLETVILPMHGYGLWSTMYAYVALDGRGERVKGVTFYSHAETPGLGAEIENPRWRASWRASGSPMRTAGSASTSRRASPRRTRPSSTWTRSPGPRSPPTAWRTWCTTGWASRATGRFSRGSGTGASDA